MRGFTIALEWTMSNTSQNLFDKWLLVRHYEASRMIGDTSLPMFYCYQEKFISAANRYVSLTQQMALH